MSANRPAAMGHQTAGVEFLRRAERALLADDPGLGKSRQLIEASVGDTLVVAPAGVINGGTWRDEIERWADDPSRFTVVPFTGLAQRQGSKVLPSLKPEFDREWGTLVVDEAHYVKGRKTGWTDRVKDLAYQTDRVYLATGTPISNWAYELFTLLQIVFPDEARPGKKFGSYWRWVGDWFDVQSGRFSAYEIGGLKACSTECQSRPAWDPCEHYAQFMDTNLSDRFLARKREAVLDLPEATEQWVQTPMDKDTRRAYNQLKKEYMADLGEGTELLAWTAGSRQVMLDQLTTSPWVASLASGEWPEKGSRAAKGGKLDQLREDLENRPRPTLVVAHYRASVEGAAQVARQVFGSDRVGMVHGGVAKKDAARVIEQFKAGELAVLVGSLETVAEGLTLVAADMCIFLERSYKPYRNVQAMRRIHRMGQTRPVTIRYYLTPNSIDSKRQELLDSKNDQQMRMLNARDFAKLL